MATEKKTYIIANWKMNFSPGEASIYLHKLTEKVKPGRNVRVVLAPNMLALQTLSLQVERRQFRLAAQNFYWRDFGAFTGETSIAQLRGVVDYVLVGHSERRYIFGENDKDVRRKVAAALRHQITPVLCVGETADERENRETDAAISDQLLSGLSDVAKEDITKVIVAYEPVWAISSTQGARLATPDEVAAAVKRIRQHVASLYGKAIADELTVLYGGSVNSACAGAYLDAKGVDGLLVGSASLIIDEFGGIVDTAKERAKDE